MKHNSLPLFGLLLFGGLSYALQGSAQQAAPSGKMDAAISQIVQRRAALARATRSSADSSDTHLRLRGRVVNVNAPLRLSISTVEGAAENVAAHITALGGTATVITDAMVTATVPAAALDTLSTLPEVKRLTFPRRFRPSLNKARADAGVTKVHTGTGLDTPFTGRGVVIGVIDQGFEFRHAAFLDPTSKNSRVKMLWDRSGYSSEASENKDTRPTAVIPTGTDLAKPETGHATHVTNIAAGSEVGNTGLKGVAPEADIIMIPSSFDDAEIMEDVKFVKEYAQQAKQPWVVNMSFGSQTGPHDGTTDYDQSIDKLLDGRGGFITAAMGNEGDLHIHSQATLAPGETKYLLVDVDFQSVIDGEAEDEFYTNVDIWGSAADGATHFEITPFLYSGGEMLPQTAKYWKKVIDESSELGVVNANNNRELHRYFLDLRAAWKNAVLPGEEGEEDGATDDINMKIGFKITAKADNKKAENLHVWVDGNGLSAGVSKRAMKDHEAATLQADDEYIVGEGAASIPRAIAVGAYATNTDYKGEKISEEKVGQITSFSSNGPFLNENYLKPAVLAPGSFINSAQNKLAEGFDSSDEDLLLTTSVGRGRDKSWYGLMEGTSQAAPFMAGTIALWLQAYPHLSHEQVMEILKKTSRKHADMKGKDWDSHYGYGLVDAYEGLKEALRLGKLEGLARPSASLEPVSISRTPAAWRVLFNNPEREATLVVYTLDGRAVLQRHLSGVQQAHEEVIDLAQFKAGAYVLSITTPGTRMARRLIVTH